jgi:hypothetical protein
MLDSPEGVCPGQVRFEYPATSVLFSNSTDDLRFSSRIVKRLGAVVSVESKPQSITLPM